MSQIIIGIDPDSKKHGVAIYLDGVLSGLWNLELMMLKKIIKSYREKGYSVICAIEHVHANTSTFRAGGSKSKSLSARMGHGVGMVHQASVELCRMLDHIDVPYSLYKISNRWKSQSDKRFFELATGWEGLSNEDTRSAAYFGYQLVVKHGNK